MVRSGGCGNVTPSRVSLWPVHMIILVKMEAELTGAAEGWAMKLEIFIRTLLQWVVGVGWTSNERLKPFVNNVSVPYLRISFIRIGA